MIAHNTEHLNNFTHCAIVSFYSNVSLYSQYNIKKKEEIVEALPQEEPNPLMRKKKTPEELAAEAELEDLDDFTSKYKSVAVW